MRLTALESEGLYPQARKADPSLRNLALGILLQAFRDIVAPKKTSNKEWEDWRQDALDWFYAQETEPGSFYWVCEVLEMNPNELRHWLQEYRKSDAKHKKEMARKLTRFQIRH
ncbi:MAG TPA: hypothetical protein PLM33_12105 [Acidobacteriota bacterium]|jgi:hypothetical protein|nr:hypothetical protein [Acidobacteriota bacterium]